MSQAEQQIKFGNSLVAFSLEFTKAQDSISSFITANNRLFDARLELQIAGLELACVKIEQEAAKDELIQAAHEMDLASLQQIRTRMECAEHNLQARLREK